LVGRKYYTIGEGATYEYTIDTDTWTSRTPPPSGTGAAGIGAGRENPVINGMLVCAFGLSGSFYNTALTYTPATDTWKRIQDAPSPARDGVMVAVVDDQIYFIGGRNTSGADGAWANPWVDLLSYRSGPSGDEWTWTGPGLEHMEINFTDPARSGPTLTVPYTIGPRFYLAKDFCVMRMTANALEAGSGGDYTIQLFNETDAVPVSSVSVTLISGSRTATLRICKRLIKGNTYTFRVEANTTVTKPNYVAISLDLLEV